MTTRHLVDKALLAALDERPDADMTDENLLAARANIMQTVGSVLVDREDGIRVTEIYVPGPANIR